MVLLSTRGLPFNSLLVVLLAFRLSLRVLSLLPDSIVRSDYLTLPMDLPRICLPFQAMRLSPVATFFYFFVCGNHFDSPFALSLSFFLSLLAFFFFHTASCFSYPGHLSALLFLSLLFSEGAFWQTHHPSFFWPFPFLLLTYSLLPPNHVPFFPFFPEFLSDSFDCSTPPSAVVPPSTL